MVQPLRNTTHLLHLSNDEDVGVPVVPGLYELLVQRLVARFGVYVESCVVNPVLQPGADERATKQDKRIKRRGAEAGGGGGENIRKASRGRTCSCARGGTPGTQG